MTNEICAILLVACSLLAACSRAVVGDASPSSEFPACPARDLYSKDRLVFERAQKLCENRGAAAAPALLAVATDPGASAYTRGAALGLLCSIRPIPAAAQELALREATRTDLSDAVQAARLAVASACLPDDLLLSLLHDALNHPAASVRVQAAIELGDMGARASSAVGWLVDSVNDPSPDVRATAASSLGRIGLNTEPVISALTRATGDPDAEVRRLAGSALSLVKAGVRN